MADQTAPLSFADVAAAQARIAPHIRPTPVLQSAALDQLTGAQLLFKAENLQPPGAFKARGACNAVFSLSETEAARGVLTHSSGNHGSALAFAAQARAIPCTVVMPETAPQAKKDAVAFYGGKIVTCAPTVAAREATAAALETDSGARFVHPYNDLAVIAGQATCALELFEQAPGLEGLIAPIGGGGLMAGSCLTARTRAPGLPLFGAVPAQADDAARSLAAGRMLADEAPQTIADGLKMPLKANTWAFIRRDVAAIFTVSEAQIIAAMKLAWAHLRLVVEPSSAVPLAALLAQKDRFEGQRIGVILTGGNVDLDRLPWMAPG